MARLRPAGTGCATMPHGMTRLPDSVGAVIIGSLCLSLLSLSACSSRRTLRSLKTPVGPTSHLRSSSTPADSSRVDSARRRMTDAIATMRNRTPQPREGGGRPAGSAPRLDSLPPLPLITRSLEERMVGTGGAWSVVQTTQPDATGTGAASTAVSASTTDRSPLRTRNGVLNAVLLITAALAAAALFWRTFNRREAHS